MRRPSHFAGVGWVYLNPHAGLEYARYHPKHSGECPDAEDVRRSTEMEDALHDTRVGSWRELKDEIEWLRKHIRVLIDNDPSDGAADGVDVLHVWRKAALERFGEWPP